MKIWAHTIVQNEENFVWFAVKSVINYVDQVLIYDTGSEDKTVEIIKLLVEEFPEKITFKEIGKVDAIGFTKLRQQMLELSNCDYIIVLDGDEIWWEGSIKSLCDVIRKYGRNYDAVVVPFYNVVGDVYHFQEEGAGRYKILGKTGHLQVKAINTKIPGLHVDFPHPLEAYLNRENTPIQQSQKLYFLDQLYFHVSRLKRSSKERAKRKKYEVGRKFKDDFKYPEVFYLEHPRVVPSPWEKMTKRDLAISLVLKPVLKIKRKLRT